MSKRPVVTLGDRLRAARLKAQKSQYQVAREAGVRPEVVSRIETGKSPGSLGSLHTIAPVVGLTIDDLTTDPTVIAKPKGKKP